MAAAIIAPILNVLASPVGQALAAAGIAQVVTIASGGDPQQAAIDFATAVANYQNAVAGWDTAEKTTPAPDAPIRALR